MLYTNLKHIESAAQHVDIIKEGQNIMVICGRMEPQSITLYRLAEDLEADFPNVKFYDMESDNPDLDSIHNLPEFEGFMGIPFAVFYKNGMMVKATSEIQTKDQIAGILHQEFM